MYKLNFLSKENDLNKAIKNHKREQSDFSILFISLWDDYCTSLVEKLKETYANVENGKASILILWIASICHTALLVYVTLTKFHTWSA
jgi:hypothetical protein